MSKSPVPSLLLFAFLLRLAFLFLAGVNAPLTGDELAYQQIAENLAGGHGFFQTNNPFFPGQTLYAWQAPLYPLSLGVIYDLLGNNLLIAKLWGIVLSTATVFASYDLARRVFKDTRVSLTSGVIVAVYPGLLTNAHLLLSETLFTFLLVLAFDVFALALTQVQARRAMLWWIVCGATWGLATLTRGITLYFAAPMALVIAWVIARQSHTWQRASISAALFVVSIIAVILPWSLRNYTVFNQFVLLETKGGVNFWLGNSPLTPSDFIRNVWKVGVREPMLAALPRDEIERDRVGYRLGLEFVRQQPLTFLGRMPVKFADFWGFERSMLDVAEATVQGAGWNSPAKFAADVLAALTYVVVLIAAIGGIVWSPSDSWKLLLGGFIAYFVFAHIVIFGDGRFHLPLIPLLALYGGWFFVHARRIQYRDARLAVASALVTIFGVVWLHEILAALTILRTPL